jgi:hypothetical protein
LLSAHPWHVPACLPCPALQRLDPEALLGRHKWRKDKEERLKSVMEGEWGLVEGRWRSGDRCAALPGFQMVQGGSGGGRAGAVGLVARACWQFWRQAAAKR